MIQKAKTLTTKLHLPEIETQSKPKTPTMSIKSNRENIKVCLRIKPKDKNTKNFLTLNGKIVSTPPVEREPEHMYSFDEIYDETATQQDIFQTSIKQICDSCLSGYNGTVMSYGQTGSGKSYTLLGPSLLGKAQEQIAEESTGIIYRIIQYLFEKKSQNGVERTYSFSLFELYKEEFIELLKSDTKNDIILYEKDLVVHVAGANKVSIDNCPEALMTIKMHFILAIQGKLK